MAGRAAHTAAFPVTPAPLRANDPPVYRVPPLGDHTTRSVGNKTAAPPKPAFYVPDMRVYFISDVTLYGDIVTVLVGESKEKYAVHERLIRKTSPFFDAAMNDTWREGRTRTIFLPNEDPDHFAAYLMWLYRSVILAPQKKIGEPASVINREQYTSLIRLYPIGSRLMDIAYQNTILKAIIAEFKSSRADPTSLPARETLEYAYSNTTPGDPLRKLLVVIAAKTGIRYQTRAKEGPFLDFILDVTGIVTRPSFYRENLRIGEDQETLDSFLHRPIENKRKREAGDIGETPGTKPFSPSTAVGNVKK